LFFVNNLDTEADCTISKLADGTIPGGVVDTSDGFGAIPGDLDSLEK